MNGFTPPYLGAAYYPEAWPQGQVDEDIRLMLEAGLNVARIAEFAWSSLEPTEGRFEFGWIRHVVEELGKAGIATIMCTPSCTPPAWLTQKYPEVLLVDGAGNRVQHGARRHFCPNNLVYRELCAKITTKLAVEFGLNDNVIGWQIDNEVHPWEGWGCCCPVCVEAFRASLCEKFGTIEALNAAWGTRVWSETYQSFSQIPGPRPKFWHHPSLQAAWALFQGESLVRHVAFQADLLHNHVKQPVGTDMMPVLGVSYEHIHRNLDIVQYNHYDTMDNLWRQVFWMDYARPFKKAPFWNTETSACWNGSTSANGYRDRGFCRANSWLPIALGGEANLYWLWRAHWSGQELMHGSIVSSHGRPLHVMEEVQEVSRGFAAAAPFINGTRPAPTALAVHLSTHAWAQLRFQPMVNGFNYIEDMINRAYRPLMNAHLRADVVDPADSLDGYRLVFSPFLPALDEAGLRERLRLWIEAGGTWVVGPFTDVLTLDGAKQQKSPFGSLEQWAGLYCKFEIPGDPRDFGLKWSNGTLSTGSLWYAGFELKGARSLATYTEGPLDGLAAVTETRLGNGRIVVLGTLPPPADLQKLMVGLAAECGVYPAAEATPNVLVVPREGEAGKGIIVVELENRSGVVKLQKPAIDVLSGAEYSGEFVVHPYQVMVLIGAPSEIRSLGSVKTAAPGTRLRSTS